MTLTSPPPHPYAQQMMNTNLPTTIPSSNPTIQATTTPYPVLQASSLPSSNPMVQLPVLPHQQHMYPTLQGASYMPYGMNNQPIPPVQFIGQQQATPYPTTITTEPIQIQQQLPYTTTITTTTTTIDGNGGMAQASTEDSTMRMRPTSTFRQMLNKLKTRVRSPTALIGSLCNLLALTLLLQIIGVIWVAADTNGWRFPVFVHVIFWILVVLETISMLLKSPIMMALNLALNLVCLIGTMVHGYGILMSLFFFSSIFCTKLGFRYLIKVNAKKQAATDLENTGEVSQANAETLKSRNPVLALIDSLKSNQKFVIEYKLSDLLIGAE
ncbi:predicted protein [Naegleria gruberi]|uniref:Predicted protein n=1 Tax=Naegleria gruberi TaxID=5762 RepID=D2VPV8_NAEGR|nr:uncharacterized protein NAEGRDRAFT_80792 [Naegleria gruberi]EFC41273.1 predicted protein [Naegleria gruberi]|eukprot:XP_002674017.1 predicted protein [Naegleria gruberi strain NEG-M]